MKNLILFFLILPSVSVFCQEKIPEAKLTFILPNDDWKLIEKKVINDNLVYFYKRNPIIDSLDRNVIANISFVIEPVDNKMDVVSFSVAKRSQTPFNVISVLTHKDGSLGLMNAIGYKGVYKDNFGEHTVYVIHAINNKKGIQIIFDILSELFNVLDPDFKYVLKSLKEIK